MRSDQLEAGQGGVTWMAMDICGTEGNSDAGSCPSLIVFLRLQPFLGEVAPKIHFDCPGQLSGVRSRGLDASVNGRKRGLSLLLFQFELNHSVEALLAVTEKAAQ